MAGFSLSAVIAELQKLATEAPDFLAALPGMLDNFATLTAPEVELLSKWFPNIKTMETTVIADLKAVVSLFQKFGPTVLPLLVRFLTFINSLFAPAPVPPTPAGAALPGAQYPL